MNFRVRGTVGGIPTPPPRPAPPSPTATHREPEHVSLGLHFLINTVLGIIPTPEFARKPRESEAHPWRERREWQS